METRAFFESLAGRAERDSAVIAGLRRSLMYEPGTFPAVFPYVEPFAARQFPSRRRMSYLAAGLWALAQRRESGPPASFGAAWRALARRRASGSIESRFTALIGADEDELAWRLRQAVQLLAAEGIALDWPALLDHLYQWGHPDRWVQQAWARDYWRSADDAESVMHGASA